VSVLDYSVGPYRESAGEVLESWWIRSSQGLRFYEW